MVYSLLSPAKMLGSTQAARLPSAVVTSLVCGWVAACTAAAASTMPTPIGVAAPGPAANPRAGGSARRHADRRGGRGRDRKRACRALQHQAQLLRRQRWLAGTDGRGLH